MGLLWKINLLNFHVLINVQDPSVTAATSAQPGAGQEDYNPFADEGPKEKEPEVRVHTHLADAVELQSHVTMLEWFG